MSENFIRVTPFLNVPDLDAAVAFFRDTLGFTVYLHFPNNYAYVQRECAGFRILQCTPGNDFVPGNRRFAHYIDVEDLDTLYVELKPKLDLLPTGDVYGPVDRPYNQRELLILAPDGNLLVFGQETAEPQAVS